MTQQPPQRDMPLVTKADTGIVEEDAGLINLSPVSVSTTIIDGAPLDRRRAVDAFQATLWRPPVAGMLSVIFAVVAFYHATLLLAPLAILAGIVAFFRHQRNWALIGVIAGIVALISDPYFWTLLGVTWTMHWLLWG